jgi:hypothetical protein
MIALSGRSVVTKQDMVRSPKTAKHTAFIASFASSHTVIRHQPHKTMLPTFAATILALIHAT